MKIVVTGATGLLGNATAKHLIAKGHEVVPVDRRDGEVAPGVKVIVGDLASLEFCDSVMVGAEAVIHLAAIPNPTDKRQHEVFTNNVVSSFAVFSAAAHAGAGNLHHLKGHLTDEFTDDAARPDRGGAEAGRAGRE